MPTALMIPLILAAGYALGCFSPGYWLVRWRRGGDVRAQGSGATGATNAGRALGRGGFAAVLLLDMAKGAAAVALAHWAGLPAWIQALAGLAAVAGHIWPAPLRFRGGKGIAPGAGAMLLIDWSGTLLAGAVALLLLAALRRFTISGLAGVAAFPLLCLARGLAAPVVAVAAALSALVLWAHRANIKSFLGRQNPP